MWFFFSKFGVKGRVFRPLNFTNVVFELLHSHSGQSKTAKLRGASVKVLLK